MHAVPSPVKSGPNRTDRQSGHGICRPVIPFQRRFGWRAAVASSSRRTGAVWGASRTTSGEDSASSAIAIYASANASSVSRLSVSVGSMSIASSTINGK